MFSRFFSFFCFISYTIFNILKVKKKIRTVSLCFLLLFAYISTAPSSSSEGVLIRVTVSPLMNTISHRLSDSLNSSLFNWYMVSTASLSTMLQCESNACSVPTSVLAPRSLMYTLSSRLSFNKSKGVSIFLSVRDVVCVCVCVYLSACLPLLYWLLEWMETSCLLFVQTSAFLLFFFFQYRDLSHSTDSQKGASGRRKNIISAN
ncbi:Lsm3p [Saccharomyces cerevisiae Lalvin QA23]|nr:Lsm3p [Saccharomyces cerevisiae Lalvin QA23]